MDLVPIYLIANLFSSNLETQRLIDVAGLCTRPLTTFHFPVLAQNIIISDPNLPTPN